MDIAEYSNILQCVIRRVFIRIFKYWIRWYTFLYIVANIITSNDFIRRPFSPIVARRNREMIVREFVTKIQAATRTLISYPTTVRRLNNNGWYVRKPIVCVPYTPLSKAARLNCCRYDVQLNQVSTEMFIGKLKVIPMFLSLIRHV